MKELGANNSKLGRVTDRQKWADTIYRQASKLDKADRIIVLEAAAALGMSSPEMLSMEVDHEQVKFWEQLTESEVDMHRKNGIDNG